MNFIMKIKERIEDKNYRFQAIVREINPVFSDRFGTTNKDSLLLMKNDRRVGLIPLITQNNEPIEFHKDFYEFALKRGGNKHRGDLDFEVNGVKTDIIYEVKGLGYLENYNSMYRVILVSDSYVFTEILGSGRKAIHSHREIERFKEMNAFSVKKQ